MGIVRVSVIEVGSVRVEGLWVGWEMLLVKGLGRSKVNIIYIMRQIGLRDRNRNDLKK